MANPQQQTPTATKPEAPKTVDPLDGFTPNDSTFWLCQELASIETAAQMALQDRYGQLVGRIVSQLDVRRLSDRHTIVPVYVDNRSPVRDEDTGKLRVRRNRGENKDPLALRFGKPISCAKLAVTDDDTGFTNVQMANLKDEDGTVRKGLIALGTDACMRTNARGKPEATCKFRYRSDDSTLTLTDL